MIEIEITNVPTLELSAQTPPSVSCSVPEVVYIEGEQPTEVIAFAVSDWVLTDDLYTLTLLVSDHSMGMNAFVSDVERVGDDVYKNVWYSYSRLVNGTIIVSAHIAFDGRLLLTEG